MRTSDGAALEQKLQESANALGEAVSTLSDEQARIAPPGRWSVLECIEHITLVQDGFSSRIRSSPLGVERVADPEHEAELHRAVQSRERTFPAPPVVVPRNQFATLAEAMAHFQQSHRKVSARMRRVEPQLRSLQVQHPALGLLSGYEAFLVISGHTLRHVAQICELVSTEGVTVDK